MGTSKDIVQRVLDLPLFHAGWVLYFLLLLSLGSFAVIFERAAFYRSRRVDLSAIRTAFAAALEKNDYAAAAAVLEAQDSLETNAVLFGLRQHAAGPDAVEDLVSGALTKEKERYDARLDILATLASNAPFIGLFGTVLGIIRAFKDLAQNAQSANVAVMSGVAEALVATAVGLFVAIPAVVAFNFFKGRVKKATNNAQFLAKILLAHLKATS
jgi:biopolymer transport protein ExbB/TolQ